MTIALRFPIALVLSIVCLAVPAWADFPAGMDAYFRGDYATALREWRSLAKQGNAKSWEPPVHLFSQSAKRIRTGLIY